MVSNENLTILITDIAGFTARTSGQSRQQQQAMQERHDSLLQAALEMYEGEWIKSTGDGILAVFRSPTNAVQCGMAIQDMFAEYNHDRDASEQIHVRVALNLGEVRRQGRDVFGEAVNVCARVEALAAAGEVYFTQAVYLAMNKAEVPTESLGAEEIRGIPEPVELYRVPTGQVTRLVASGEPLPATGIAYPFGGIPHPSLADTDSSKAARHLRRVVIVVLLLLTGTAAALYLARNLTPATNAPAVESAAKTGDQPVATPQPEAASAKATEPTQAKTASSQTKAGVSAAIQRRNDLFLTLTHTLDGPAFYLRRHPDSDWAYALQVARNRDHKALSMLQQRANSGQVEAQLGLAWLYGSGKGVPRSQKDAQRWLQMAEKQDAGLANWLRAMALFSDQARSRPAARKRAWQLLQDAASGGEALAQTYAGVLILEGRAGTRDTSTAAQLLGRAAAQGMGFAQAALASLYLEGNGVRKDPAQAVELLQRAAQGGDPTGQYYLGLLLERGYGIEKDLARAQDLYRNSASAGYPPALEKR